MQNVEYKAELRDPELARSIARALKASFIGALHQKDTYFRITHGRLKKRESKGEPTEYIFYDRANRSSAKLSHFMIYSESAALERFGTNPLPTWVVVEKDRDIYMLGNVRIHIDQVHGLAGGAFIEFEALVSRDYHVLRCHEAIDGLRESFAPVLGEAISGSYADLLALELEGLPEAGGG